MNNEFPLFTIICFNNFNDAKYEASGDLFTEKEMICAWGSSNQPMYQLTLRLKVDLGLEKKIRSWTYSNLPYKERSVYDYIPPKKGVIADYNVHFFDYNLDWIIVKKETSLL